MECQGLRSGRRGAALVLALLSVCIFAALSVAFAVSADLNLQKARNTRLVSEARLAAESGLAYFACLLASTEVKDSVTGQGILDSVAAALAERLDGSAALHGGAISYDGSRIVVPVLDVDGGRSFTAEITVARKKVLLLTVVGRVPTVDVLGGAVQRAISIEAELASSGAFEYGMYAKGPINIGANVSYLGANDPNEASMFSAASGVAITVDSGHIDGDVLIHDPSATVDVGATVGGEIRVAENLPLPEVDGSIFEPFATNIVDAATDTSAGTFTNIRVKAGTNPSFGNDVTIQGVMFIEAPNKVEFTNNVNITGVIVSEDPGEGALPDAHCVSFNNSLSVQGLDDLPEEPQFAELREMPGSAFLLPGFTLEFKNNFTSVNGTIAAEQIVLKNNLVGTVYGSIIALGETGLELKNNSTITIDRSRYGDMAPGIYREGPQRLVFLPSTYTEH